MESTVRKSGLGMNEKWEMLETSITLCRECGKPLFLREIGNETPPKNDKL